MALNLYIYVTEKLCTVELIKKVKLLGSNHVFFSNH